MPIQKVTDPALLQQLNAGSGPAITNPMFPAQLQGQALQNQRYGAELPYVAPKARADASNAATQAQVNAATAPAEIAQKRANARQTAAQATTAERNLETTGGANEGQAKSASFYTRATRANQLYEGTGVKDQPAGRSLLQSILPNAAVNEFTSPKRQQAEAAQRDFIASTLRYESGANIPQNEFELQKSIYFPAPGDDPSTIALKAQLRKNAINGLRVASGPAAQLLDKGQVADYSQMVGAPDVVPAGATVREFDPQTSAAVDKLIKMGRPVQEIANFAQSKGYQMTPDVLSSLAQAQTYAKTHPGYKGGFTDAGRTRATTSNEQSNGIKAAFSGAASAATLGLNDEAAGLINMIKGGDYTQGRDAFNAGKQLLAADNPGATLLGTAAGSILPFGVVGKFIQSTSLPGRIGAGRAALLGDTGVGAAYGAGETNEDRLGGAIKGGGASAAGNVLGQGLARGVASAISPTGGKLAPLYDMGVRPSIGQRFGGVVNNVEEKLQSIPAVGDAIEGTRQGARDQFQIGLFNSALGEIGQQLPKGMKPGHDPHAFAQKAFNNAYNAAKTGMTAAADGGLATDLGNVQRTVMTLKPDSQNTFNKVWADSVGRRFASGTLSGPAFKDVTSELEKRIAAIRNSQSGDGELAAALQEAHDALRASAMRNSPPEAVAAMDAADRGYAKLVQIENASKRAGGDAATFTPKQFEAAVKDTSNGVRKRSYLAGKALNSDIAEAGLNLSDRVSNSGTIDRLAPVAIATGLGYAEPTSLALLGGYGLANAPGLRTITTSLFAPRGGKAKTVADILREKLAIPSGTAGSALALGLLPR